MTTAGTATVAFAPEASFNGGLVDQADWFQPGVDISVTGPSGLTATRACSSGR